MNGQRHVPVGLVLGKKTLVQSRMHGLQSGSSGDGEEEMFLQLPGIQTLSIGLDAHNLFTIPITMLYFISYSGYYAFTTTTTTTTNNNNNLFGFIS
jgi:hypothetical protein